MLNKLNSKNYFLIQISGIKSKLHTFFASEIELTVRRVYFRYILLPYILAHTLFLVFLSIFFQGSYFLAPDEGGYTETFESLYSKEALSSYSGFPGHSSRLEIQAIFFFAKIATNLGFSPNTAIRIQSSLMALIAFSLLFFLVKQKNRFVVCIIVCSAFLPTVFIWTSLGLRESFIYLALAMAIFSLTRLSQKISLFYIATLFLALLLLSIVKDYLFFILSISILASGIFGSILKRELRDFALSIIVISAVLIFNSGLGNSILSGIQTVLNGATTANSIQNNNSVSGEKPPNSTSQGIVALLNDDENNLILRFVAKVIMEESRSATPPSSTVVTPSATPPSSTVVTPSATSPSSTVVTPSATPPSFQINEHFSRLSLRAAEWSNPKDVIFSTIQILIRPTPFVENGSKLLNLLSFETLIWLMLLISALLLFVRRFSITHFQSVNFSLALFTVLYIYFMATYQINVGTMVRHRSVLLFPCIALVLSCKKP